MIDSKTSNLLPCVVTVQSFGRLHFGLLEICDHQPHCFGGIGMMIDHSVASVRAHVATLNDGCEIENCEILADDYWRARLKSILEHWMLTHSDLPLSRIEVEGTPSPHRGLGSGTQMACTITAILLAAQQIRIGKLSPSQSLSVVNLFEPGGTPIVKLSELSGRGKRSNIGLRGFLEGGFVFDLGESLGLASSAADQTTPMARTKVVPFPDDWPVLVIQDESSQGDSGTRESEMFEQCSKTPNAERAVMLELITDEIAPSIAEADWNRFDRALGRYGRLAGAIFEPAQGGIYRTPQIAETIQTVQKLGVAGATQSSWGPTVCAIARDTEHAQWCKQQLQTRLPRLRIDISRAVNHSAQVVTS